MARPVKTLNAVDAATFEAVREAGVPVLFKGLVAHWPMVASANRGPAALVADIVARASPTPVTYAIGAPEIEGRFHYADDVSHLNFERQQTSLAEFLGMLLAEAGAQRSRALAGQGLALHQCLPSFAPSHPMPLLPPAVLPRMWVSNAAKVATH